MSLSLNQLVWNLREEKINIDVTVGESIAQTLLEGRQGKLILIYSVNMEIVKTTATTIRLRIIDRQTATQDQMLICLAAFETLSAGLGYASFPSSLDSNMQISRQVFLEEPERLFLNIEGTALETIAVQGKIKYLEADLNETKGITPQPKDRIWWQ